MQLEVSMASPKAEFRTDSESITKEHEELMKRLALLDRALDEIVCYSDVYANLAGVHDIKESGQWLTAWLPSHFEREETTVLASMARMGPEPSAFALEMARQHQQIQDTVKSFCEITVGLESCSDLEETIYTVKESGKNLVAFMAAHMGAEERRMVRVRM